MSLVVSLSALSPFLVLNKESRKSSGVNTYRTNVRKSFRGNPCGKRVFSNPFRMNTCKKWGEGAIMASQTIPRALALSLAHPNHRSFNLAKLRKAFKPALQ
jgi:hypothetical protein